MHEKKMKSYGGIEMKYLRELATVDADGFNLAYTVNIVLEEMRRDDSDHGDIQVGWLNSPYQILLKVESEVADLEAKVKADPQFSDKLKEMFISDVIKPIKDGNRRVREIDAYIMNGTPVPPSR